MKNTTKNSHSKEKLHLKVLQKFLNQLVFGKMSDPKFSAVNEDVKINQKTLAFIKSFIHEDGNSDLKINDFFNSVIEVFESKLKDSDKRDLMCCYFDSNLKIIKDILKMFSSKDDQSRIENKKLEFEMVDTFLSSTKIPKDLANYLKAQFHDILQHVDFSGGTMCNKTYTVLKEKYVRKYEQEEVLSMIYNESEKPD